MAYNSLTEREKLNRRLTARQALPKNYTRGTQRNLGVTRYAGIPSNDANLRFESRTDENVETVLEVVEEIRQVIEDIPVPEITSPKDGDIMTDPLYPISGTAAKNATVELLYKDRDEPVAAVQSAEDGTFIFQGDTPAAEGVSVWSVRARGKTSEQITVTLETEDPVEPVSFKTHAASEEFLVENGIDAPTGWENMTLKQKSDWINSQ